jgi:hypothetical protein
MTQAQDQIAVDAAKAARIIKETAEQTATSLNISYIQKDISEIKENIKALAMAQDGKVDDLKKDVYYLQKVVYMGLGGLTVLSFLLKFFNF